LSLFLDTPKAQTRRRDDASRIDHASYFGIGTSRYVAQDIVVFVWSHVVFSKYATRTLHIEEIASMKRIQRGIAVGVVSFVVILFSLVDSCHAFARLSRGGRPSSFSSMGRLFGQHNNHNQRGGNNDQPPPSQSQWTSDGYGEDKLAFSSSQNNTMPSIRGGSTKQKAKKSKGIIKNSQVSVSKTVDFWKSAIGSAGSKVTTIFESKELKKEKELMEQLQAMPIRAVVVANSSILPPDVVRLAVKRSGLIGNPLRTDRVQEIARNLKRWYVRKGYVLHSVTGANLNPDTGVAELTVQEPTISENPVNIVACKEMVVEEGTGEVMTFKQFRDKHLARKSFGHDKLDKSNLNTTFVETDGRTKASRIAHALRLKPGEPFCWDGSRWQNVARSGIFSRVLRSSPERMPDGTIQLQIIVTEPPPRHLEYGLGKSMYTGSWEGEIDFEHQNLLGGGETVGLMVRRGSKDAEPSVRLRYSDEKFGLEGGYDVEVFSDFIGTNNEDQGDQKTASPNQDHDDDILLDRRGATFRLRNPIDPNRIRNSVASASMERTSTRTGLQESIGSATLTIGPFQKLLPLDARSHILSTVTTGTRFGEKEKSEGFSRNMNLHVLPYSSISATTRQVLPLTSATENKGVRHPIVLALSHTVSTSSRNLPRHEAKAMGVAAEIRGARPDGRVSSSVTGTTELRVPISIPKLGDGSVVLFGDWFCVQKDAKSPFYSKSSIGVGFRKNFQGLPLKYDVCYSAGGKIKTMFGLGQDFDV
jgi:hypothetical protein